MSYIITLPYDNFFFSGIGITQVAGCLDAALPYNLILAWSIYYLYRSFWPVLPWTTCAFHNQYLADINNNMDKL